MRVIAGKFRSRRLRSPGRLGIRPTSDRLRETLFDILSGGDPQALVGSLWIDLFAGTGAVGIEALSRGAAMVYFVESAKGPADLIRENLEALGIQSGFALLRDEGQRSLRAIDEQGFRPNYIFLDPPYEFHYLYGEILDALSSYALGECALVIAEHEKRFDPGEKLGSFRRLRKLDQGDAVLGFYRRPPLLEPSSG